MHEVASVLMEHSKLEKMIDVPLSLQHGTRKLPLGRYLRRKLRTFIGRDADAPAAVIHAQKEQLRPLLEAAKAVTPKGVPGLLETNFKDQILTASEGRRIQIERRNKGKKGIL